MTATTSRQKPAADRQAFATPVPAAIATSVITMAFVALFVSVIFLQKFGITVGDATVPFGLIAAYAIILFLMIRNIGQINVVRLALFGLFFGIGLLNLIMHQNASALSFLLVSVLAC